MFWLGFRKSSPWKGKHLGTYLLGNANYIGEGKAIVYSLLLARVQLPGVVQLLRLGGCIHSKVPELTVGIDFC